ncbi:choline ABC transporter substrate-binding protein [Curvibacter sp. CHRR-16]|uniref:choline ABC transporter substrate-binding protein n=1 Tax=Curvibacter sp. CHRR-16 TaxID=2835872 RepID=UPI001BD92C5D|nr:choline ABC transporter substrate-binding protein [Curvibacter sp. CHRR-16]MBT0570693.1 choline ABC transporter substrate-binding protein [Curvibacter sp. CHRR-16]
MSLFHRGTVGAVVALLSTLLPLHSQAAESAACQKVKFADVGWTDIAATTGLASVVLEELGYKPSVTMASVPIAFAGLKNKQLDVFLGYWNPSMTPMIEPFVKAGQIKVLDKPNLVGAKYTLAVPEYLYTKGLKSFADIAKFSKELDGKIFGIEPGNDGNALVQGMIDKNQFNLKGFKVVESSEAGMLAEVQRAVKNQKPIVFLGWEPHPMNVQVKMRYLEGGDDVFGPNYGEAKVYTAMPPDYETRCPNVGQLIRNLTFSTQMENEVMLPIMSKTKPNAAARAWLKKNPAVLNDWLKGVTTVKGEDGLAAVKKGLGL